MFKGKHVLRDSTSILEIPFRVKSQFEIRGKFQEAFSGKVGELEEAIVHRRATEDYEA
jgi:hypothetical protein